MYICSGFLCLFFGSSFHIFCFLTCFFYPFTLFTPNTIVLCPSRYSTIYLRNLWSLVRCRQWMPSWDLSHSSLLRWVASWLEPSMGSWLPSRLVSPPTLGSSSLFLCSSTATWPTCRQRCSTFRASCRKLWMRDMPKYNLSLSLFF